MKSIIFSLLILGATTKANAFCGFYVAKAGANLYNNKSEVIMVRDGNLTTLTMSNDFKGNVKDFAMVVPVPELLRERDIKVINRDIFGKIDAYSAPRMVEYYDEGPCQQYTQANARFKSVAKANFGAIELESTTKDDYHVKIEAQYSIGEYDIIILSAEQSGGLEAWLKDNGYSIPDNAKEVLQPYINDKLKFFVVKVNLNNVGATGFDYLRPIQITYSSERFMLPIRLGMANSKGFQDLVVYTFTRNGRVECTNYRTEKMPTGNNVPTFVLNQFDSFYMKTFDRQYVRNNKNTVFLEYAWNVTPSFNGMKCDPCVGNPPMLNEFAEAGVSWLAASPNASVFFTRLHVRYSREDFPQDLMFQATPNMEQYQARYVINHPAIYTDCEKGKAYLKQLEERKVDEVLEFCKLTGERSKQYEWYAPNLSKNLPGDDGNSKSIKEKIIHMFDPDSGETGEDIQDAAIGVAGGSDDDEPKGNSNAPLYLLLLPLFTMIVALIKKAGRIKSVAAG